METPKKRNFVRPAMAPIEADLAHHQGAQRARPDRPSRDRHLNAPRHDGVCAKSHQRQRRGQQQRGYQAADEIKADIAGEAFADDFSPTHREQAFQWQEDHGEQQQPRPKPHRGEEERVKMLVVQKRGQRLYPDFSIRRRSRIDAPGRGCPSRRASRSGNQTAALRFLRRRQATPPRPRRPTPRSDRVAGSGIVPEGIHAFEEHRRRFD